LIVNPESITEGGFGGADRAVYRRREELLLNMANAAKTSTRFTG
jgi:hypothetical protein